MRSLVGEGGFEPPKSLTADLQSVPFGHSGIPPYSLCCTHFETQRSGFKMKRRKAIADMELFASAESGMEQASFDGGAGRRIRTPDLLITNQLLYRLSYTSNSNSKADYRRRAPKSQELFEKTRNIFSGGAARRICTSGSLCYTDKKGGIRYEDHICRRAAPPEKIFRVFSKSS